MSTRDSVCEFEVGPGPGPTLTPQERAVLAVLQENRGRVVGRAALARHSGMTELSARRCDSVIVGLRRRLGTDAILTVRSRGWMLSE